MPNEIMQGIAERVIELCGDDREHDVQVERIANELESSGVTALIEAAEKAVEPAEPACGDARCQVCNVTPQHQSLREALERMKEKR